MCISFFERSLHRFDRNTRAVRITQKEAIFHKPFSPVASFRTIKRTVKAAGSWQLIQSDVSSRRRIQHISNFGITNCQLPTACCLCCQSERGFDIIV
jgi:hypothetical protein